MATEDRLPAEILKGNTVVPIEQLVSTSPLKHWRIAINDLINFGTTLAPENHASSTRIYGIGNKDSFGHLKLVDELDLAYDVLYGAAITPLGVKTETDKCLHIGNKLDKTNVDSIDGKLLFGEVTVDTVTADTFTGFLEGTARQAINDEKGNNIIDTYSTKVELKEALTPLRRDGESIQWNGIKDPSKASSCIIYQNDYAGYMPALNLAAKDGDRVGLGTYNNKCSWTYFSNANDTNTPDASFDLIPTGVQVTGKATITNGCAVSNDIYVNSSKNSVILNNDGTNFNVKIATTLNGTPQALIPLSFVLANTKSSYDNSDITGKMTIGGDLHTQGTITATGKVHNAIWNDYAEFFEKGEETEVGDFVALDLSSDEEVYVKASVSNPTVIGVHSDSYGYILGGTDDIKESEKTHIPVGLAGRVKAKIVGTIKKGDYVVLSTIPGVGCVYDKDKNNPLDVVGIAVESSDDIDIKLVKIKLK